MKTRPLLICGGILGMAALCHAQPALTIYNQNFATVRDVVPLNLKAGINDVRFSEVTAQVEPDSVILRDPKGTVALRILEQNYRNDPISQGLLLSLNEGKVIDFFVKGGEGRPDRTMNGKIIRSGYMPASTYGMPRYGYQVAVTPIIEVDGLLMFELPGVPRFPSLADDTVLKPTLTWHVHAEQAAKLDAEIAYITGGMSWEAAYNITSPEKGDVLDLSGWVTMNNQSGKTFSEAKVQLVAGDVSKVQPAAGDREWKLEGLNTFTGARGIDPVVTAKSFDEYHLYSLPLPTTLHDRETKQVEFVHATGVKAERIYVYDGVKIDRNRWGNSSMASFRSSQEYGTESNLKVWVMREIENSEANHLGLPLPRGKVRFYRQDDEGQAQFVGENLIDHAPKDETLRIYTGNAFDIVGERKRTAFKVDQRGHRIDESFEIKVRNHKKEAAEVRVVEHLYRWTNWEIKESSGTHVKTDAQTIEFRTPLKAGEERTIAYTVHYSW